MLRKILAPFVADLQRTVSPPESYWRSLRYFNLYRLTVSGFFVVSFLVLDRIPVYGAEDPRLFFGVSVIYVLFGMLMALAVRLRWPPFILQLSVQSLGDVLFIVLLMHASDGVKSGIGMLLVVSLAASSLISKGRQAMFFAAVAAIAVLLEQSFRIFVMDAKEDYFQAAMLGMGFFAIAGLGYFLARQVVASERLAKQKSIDLENLAQVNELVIHEMQDGVLVVDGKGRVRTHNARCEGLLGPPPRIWSDLRLNDYAPALAERLMRWRRDRGSTFAPLQVRATGKQVHTRFSPIDAGSDVGAVIFLEDVSLQQAQAQQVKLAALGRLTANIAHEIRNPLSAISPAAQLLREEAASGAAARLPEIIEANARRLDRLVQD
ncbi:MAG: histidine kinase dimerization/phospho-acceptor domain-containing protein, partial [Sulfurimicrobium sp.]